jgi:hypothetical protein
MVSSNMMVVGGRSASKCTGIETQGEMIFNRQLYRHPASIDSKTIDFSVLEEAAR